VDYSIRLQLSFNLFATLSSAAKMKVATVLLAAAATVSAHSTWQELWVGTEDKAGTCVRTVKDNSPVTGLTSPDMFCGRGPAASSGVCEVAGTLPFSPNLSCFP
jgi:cellulase